MYQQYKKGMIYLLVIIMCISMVACGGNEEAPDTEGNNESGEPVYGGIVRVAYDQDPLTIDWMSSDASSTTHIGSHIFELLFAPDADLMTKPMLAEGYELSDDELVYTIKLRQGVLFHDGSKMTSEDVVASFNRWGQISLTGMTVMNYVDKIEAPDDYTVVVTLKSSYGSFINAISDQQASLAIIPAEIAEAAGVTPLNEDQLIGTGPFTFDSWERGNKIVLKKFEDYVSRTEDWGGFAGKKTAYVDEVHFYIVSDPQVRLDGIRTGQYDYAIRANKDMYYALQDDESLVFLPSKPDSWITIGIDCTEPPFDDVNLRQAINYALDREAIGIATYGSEEFFELDGSVFFPEQGNLYTLDGTDRYYEYDPEKARQLIEASDYNGEVITLMASTNVDDHYKSAQIEAEMLKDVGFNVEILPLEWATYLEKVGDTSLYDIFVTGFPIANDVPSVLWVSHSWPGAVIKPELDSIIERWVVTADQDERFALLGELNEYFYEEAPLIKIVNEIGLEAHSSKLSYVPWVSLRFWNAWFIES